MEDDEGYLESDGVCLFLGPVSKDAERAEVVLSAKCSTGIVLNELLSGERLEFFVKNVSKRMCVYGGRVFDRVM